MKFKIVFGVLAGLFLCFPTRARTQELPLFFSSSMFYFNFGYQASYYPNRTNTFLGDHGGPSFELETGTDDFKLTGYFSPWTTQPVRTTKIWNDTLYDFEEFNPIKAGLLAGTRFWVTPKTEWGFNTGLEWVTLSGFREKERRESKKIRMPTVLGAVVGLDYHRDILWSGTRFGYKMSYRYSTADYRIFNKSLDFGTHEWSILLSVGGKTFRILRPPFFPGLPGEDAPPPKEFL